MLEKLDYMRLNVMEVLMELPKKHYPKNVVILNKESYIGVMTIALAPLIHDMNVYRVKFAFKGDQDAWHPIAGIQMATERLRNGEGFYMVWNGLRPIEIECYRTLRDMWEVFNDHNLSEKLHRLPRWIPELLETWKNILKRKYEIDKIHFPSLGPYHHNPNSNPTYTEVK